ncbi:MAG: hypothetical protein AYK19_13780 [Theionarchaea archaeon DG-70-1]|nr:MAG: hypothetical protein AYK19_13780 [Theionarchaea archaeon DG-70-1]
MMKGIQLVGLVVSFYLFYKSYLLVRRREEDVKQFLFWISIGFLLFFSSLFPSIIDVFMDFLGLENRAFAILIVGVLFMYLLFFNFVSRIDFLDRQLSQINEEVSLLRYEMKKLLESKNKK